MMSRFFVQAFLFLFLPSGWFFLNAQIKPESQFVDVSIRKVTVFFEGAEVRRVGKAELKPGRQELRFRGLSPFLRKESVQLRMDVPFEMVNLDVRVPRPAGDTALPQFLREKARQMAKTNAADSLAMSVLDFEESVLQENKKINLSAGPGRQAELKQALEFFRNRMQEIRSRKAELENQIRERFDAFDTDLDRWQTQRQKGTGQSELVAVIQTEARGSHTVYLEYRVSNASWSPSYDVRLQEDKNRIQFAGFAEVQQSTGEDWKNVKLAFSNANPAMDGVLPVLDPWSITRHYPQSPVAAVTTQPRMISGSVLDAETKEPLPFATIKAVPMGSNKIANAASSDVNGNFVLLLTPPCSVEVWSIGYVKSVLSSDAISDGIQFLLNPSRADLKEVMVTTGGEPAQYGDAARSKRARQWQKSKANSKDEEEFEEEKDQKVRGFRSYTARGTGIRVEFELQEPASVLAGAPALRLGFNRLEAPVERKYLAVPRLNPEVFLKARIPDWEELELLRGKANLYLDQAFMGTTQLEPEKAGDTLELFLGKDPSIRVSRKKEKGELKREFLGSDAKVTRTWSFSARSQKSTPVDIEVHDQFPISEDAAVVVEPLEKSEADYNPQTGLLAWKFTLEPKKARTWKTSYRVKYPKNKTSLYWE